MAEQQQQDVVINMAELTLSPSDGTKKKQDTLFGPNIGIVARGPEWTETREKAIDELTPDIVRGWISKSKEANQSTTTLQALVNLKRPTLRLTPLEVSPSDDPDHIDSQHHHGLEFEYDCDAPKCGITVHIVLSPTHRLTNAKGAGNATSRVLVFEATTEGGFGRTLKLEEGATLELGRYEHQPHVPDSPSLEDKKGESSSAIGGSPLLNDDAPAPTAGEEALDTHRKSKRFTSFHFRKRTTQERSVAGPAIAVLDAETKDDKADEKADENNQGVKAVIKLSALDSAGKPLVCMNEQTTYLHIVRFGAAPPEGEQDRRPWVVKVVKREATIGSHTFHLHEIYGLSNSTSNNTSAPPPVPLPTTYPPTSTPAAPAYEDEPSSECLLCLSAPREVVLLPCRHLVACRECAINMIEFGAGGQIVHAEDAAADAPEEAAATPAGETPADGAQEGAPEGAPADSVPAAPAIPMVQPAPLATTRRKRKAKGWFCPVCRQPYTSCLRITTTPPSKDMIEDDRIENASAPAHPLAAAPAVPPPVATAPASRGGLASLVRPGFLRSLTSRQPQQDLERGQVATAAA